MACFLNEDLDMKQKLELWPKHITITLYINNNDNHYVTNDVTNHYDNVDDNDNIAIGNAENADESYG